MKHTKGPWNTNKDDYGLLYVESKDTMIADNLFDYSLNDLSVEETKEYEANARLIAASPTLLNMLQELLSVTELNLDDMEPQTRKIVRKASVFVSEFE